ncbi:hypothetical protein L6452_35411 [Arctium lappa]|uniref:Uncharacterized protein n=1 Tax=Arctium lappa TaxID=4217 RepID=A0ACB8Y7J3_ARCLA|nr:hypothetical protein L6452_35411 [Arctium lappa]
MLCKCKLTTRNYHDQWTLEIATQASNDVPRSMPTCAQGETAIVTRDNAHGIVAGKGRERDESLKWVPADLISFKTHSTPFFGDFLSQNTDSSPLLSSPNPNLIYYKVVGRLDLWLALNHQGGFLGFSKLTSSSLQVSSSSKARTSAVGEFPKVVVPGACRTFGLPEKVASRCIASLGEPDWRYGSLPLTPHLCDYLLTADKNSQLPNKLHAFSTPYPPTPPHPPPTPAPQSSLTFTLLPSFLLFNLFFLNTYLGRREGCDLCTCPNNLLHW